jgi:hypothetical protein
MRFTKALPLALLLSSSVAVADGPENLLKTDRFRGSVPGVAIRDVASGGRPWVIGSGEAKLEADGTFKLEVEGLVFPPGTVINGVDVSGTRGPITHFAATLSCIQADGTTANVTTTGFPATTTGDGHVKTKIDVPPVCYAPVVLVRSFNPTTGVPGNWFAVTGF